jgi:LPS export ABC transporter protein LptC
MRGNNRVLRQFIRRIAILTAIVVVVAGCNKEPSRDITFERGRTPDEVFTDFVTQESDSGLVVWRLTAPQGDRFKEKKLVVLDHPTIVFYDEQGKVRTTLVSEGGEYFEDKRDMLAFGRVVVTSVEGDVLETDSLFWDNTQKKILSNSFVKLTRDGDVITGYGLECKEDLRSVDIKREVKATVVDDKGEIE